ncbi:MAG TPA: J domain-containing protein [Elusimicrobiota bacterium]|jgi:hypothetical protein|nr:J domain-containing protein [Elusimicrobiota bacterium]
MTDDAAYRILEVAPDAGSKGVQAAYRRKALELHPDRAGSAQQSESFYRRFLEVRDAYEHLRRAGFPAPQAPPPEPEEAAPEMPTNWEGWVAARKFGPQGTPLKVTALEKLGFEFHFDMGSVMLWGALIPGGAYVLVKFVKFMLAAVRGPE